MTARLIDGTAVARKVREDVARGVEKLLADGGVAPGLATVLIGDDPASEVYVRNKRRLCVEAGMQDLHRHLPGDVDQATAAALIDELAADPAVSGILLQLPTPKHLDSDALIARIPAEKDVDGLTTANAGLLAQGRPGLRPCTPAGVMTLLDGVRRPPVGRGGGRGRPLGARRQADGPAAAGAERDGDDLPLAHARPRRGLPAGRRAGRRRRHPGIVGADAVKPGATVIDVGIHRERTACAGTSSSTPSPRSRARSPRCRVGSAR